ncbi:hypothetical protein GW813_11850, partial [bacterium]|nr:hypothetical protein [bacterium]
HAPVWAEFHLEKDG